MWRELESVKERVLRHAIALWAGHGDSVEMGRIFENYPMILFWPYLAAVAFNWFRVA